MRISDWSSDVCSSDLARAGGGAGRSGHRPSRCLRRRGGAAARDRALCRGKGPLMRIGVYPGIFDTITLGHMAIIRAGAKLVDRLVHGRSEERWVGKGGVSMVRYGGRPRQYKKK